MSIASVVLRGYGNGTVVGTIADVVTRGYTIGEAIPEVSISSIFRIEFPPQDRNIVFPFESREIKFPFEDRETKI